MNSIARGLSYIFFFSFLSVTLHAGSGQRASEYSVEELPTPPSLPYCYPIRVNNQGTIVGNAGAILGPTTTTVRWVNGKADVVGFGYARAINSRGEIVGTDLLWTPTAFDALSWLGKRSATLSAINDMEQIVGSIDEAGTPHAFLYDQTSLIQLGKFAGFGSSAEDINKQGLIVGWYYATARRDMRAFLWNKGTVVSLGAPVGTLGSIATRINDKTQIIGYCIGAPTTPGFLWQDGHMSAIPVLAQCESSIPKDINNKSQIVGSSYKKSTASANASVPPGSNQIAFLYQDRKLIRLDTLIPANSGWRLWDATGINDSGEIVGSGVHNGKMRPFLLKPHTLRL